MSFSLTLVAPAIRELSLTSTTLYLEVGRFSLFLNLWDTYEGKPVFALEKFDVGIGRTLHLGPITTGASWATAPESGV
jgi:hypothetical protein